MMRSQYFRDEARQEKVWPPIVSPDKRYLPIAPAVGIAADKEKVIINDRINVFQNSVENVYGFNARKNGFSRGH
jgi:hypothetical protein